MLQTGFNHLITIKCLVFNIWAIFYNLSIHNTLINTKQLMKPLVLKNCYVCI